MSPIIRELASSRRLLSIASEHLGKDAFPVQGTLFDKTSAANWLVPWHQGLTICVESREETPGYGPWSLKAGVHHVQPPAAILESMLSIRIHLDDCPESNGALRVLPGTHLDARLNDAQIEQRQKAIVPVTGSVNAGNVLLIRPLLLHVSSSATSALHRQTRPV